MKKQRMNELFEKMNDGIIAAMGIRVIIIIPYGGVYSGYLSI